MWRLDLHADAGPARLDTPASIFLSSTTKGLTVGRGGADVLLDGELALRAGVQKLAWHGGTTKPGTRRWVTSL